MQRPISIHSGTLSTLPLIKKLSFLVIVISILSGCGGGGKLSISQPIGGTVSSADSNINCGNTCSHEYTATTDVELTATADENYLFMNWTDACEGSSNTCTVAMSADKSIGTEFNAFDDPNIGAPLKIRAGTEIQANYTGSTDSYDYAAIYLPTAENTDYLNRARLVADYGSFNIRVPTQAGTYQFRMINSTSESIINDDEFEVLAYDASFSLKSPPTHPRDEVTVIYSGSTHAYDYISVYSPGVENGSYSSRTRLTEDSGEVTLTMPSEEGSYELRMVNNKSETIEEGVSVELQYNASLSTQPIAFPNETISVSFSGSTQDYDYISLHAQNDNNSTYVSRVRLNNISSGNIAITAPALTGIYNIRMVNQGNATIVDGGHVSVLSNDEVRIFGAAEIANPGQTITLAYSGVEGTEQIGIFAQGAPNNTPLNITAITTDPTGTTTLPAPVDPGFYEIRLLDSNQAYLANFNYLKVVDPQKLTVEAPKNVISGETLSAIFSGSTDEYDYVAIYAVGETNPANYYIRTRVINTNGMINIRMPTIAGDFEIRLIDSSNNLIQQGNVITVEPYNPTVELTTAQANPSDSILIHYSGSTDAYDYLGFYLPGAENNSYSTRVRIINSEGSVNLTAPSEQGIYELRMTNNKGELILNAGTINLTYDTASVVAPLFALPTETVNINFSGSTNDYDYIGIYAQEAASNTYESRVRLNGVTDGTVELTMPSKTGLYNPIMVNPSSVTIQKGTAIAILDPIKTELFTAPQITTVSQAISVAYSHISTLENATIGLYTQDAANDAPLEEKAASAFPIGRLSFTTPTIPGIYEFRLVTEADEALAIASHVYVIDENTDSIFIPSEVRAGEVLWVGYSGSESTYDYAATYQDTESDFSQYDNRKRLLESKGVQSLRMPTVPGNYQLKMINASNIPLLDGNNFTVSSYQTTATLASVAEPTETVEVNYTHSTHDYDYITLHIPGAKNTNYISRSRLTQEAGVTTLDMPDTEGNYEVRLLNNKNESISSIGTILVSYNHVISVNAQEIASPTAVVDIDFVGSTDDYDYINLYAQQSTNNNYLSRIRLVGVADGATQLTAPTTTGIYDVRMTNSGTKTISNNITVSVLDDNQTELFIAPEVVPPSTSITIAYSGSFASNNSLGIYQQGANNNTPLFEAIPQPSLANITLTTPSEGGAYEVRLANQADQTLATAKLLYVIDPAETAVHGPASVRAGDTERFSYSGSTDDHDRIAFFPQGGGSAQVVSSRLYENEGYLDVHVPTIEGSYNLRIINSNGTVIGEGDAIYIEPYDGDIEL